MQFYNTFKRSNGSYVTQEWSAQEMFNYDILSFCFITVIGSILAAISSGICLIVRLYDYDELELKPSFWGIIFGVYFMIDYWKGWFVTFILRLFEDAATMKFMANCNLAILATHILLLVFGDTVYYNTGESVRKQVLIVWTIIILVISYMVSGRFI